MKVTLNGHEHWYDTHGDGGSPVLLIMGFGMSGRAWGPQIRGLSLHHQVACYDNRGIGDTETSRVPYGFPDLAGDGLALMDHLGWDNAHVVGVSMGGMIAQHLALEASHRVRSLTLIATHPGGSVRHTVPTRRGLRLFLKANTSRGDKRLEALRSLLYTNRFLNQGEAEAEFDDESMELFAVPADRTTLKSQLRAILKHDTTRRLRQLHGVPSLIVRPGADLLVPPVNSDRLSKLIPGARLLGLVDAGHGVTHECAEEVNQHLLAHLRHADEAREPRAA